MSLLTGLFSSTVPELPVAVEVVLADLAVDPGFLYRVFGSDAPVTVTIRARPIGNLAGVRFAVKVVAAAPTPPGATLAVVVPAGQQIEDDDGQLGTSVVLADQTVGTYREWLCDDAGHWLRIAGW